MSRFQWGAVGYLLSLVACPGWLAAAPNDAAAASSWAVVFAPDKYREWESTASLCRGAEALRERLLKAGVPADHVRYLSAGDQHSAQAATAANFRQALAAVAGKAAKQDLLFVVVAARGVHVGGVDYVCAADTTRAEIQRLSRAQTADRSSPQTVVSVQEIVRSMWQSASQRQFLLLDALSGSAAPAAQGATGNLSEQFGSQLLQVPNGQLIMCNQSPRQHHAAGDKSPVSCFVRAVLDGLACHADSNQDGFVSVLELSDYVALHAESEGYTPPLLHGKTMQDFRLCATSETRGKTPSLPADVRQQLSQTLLAVGRTALALDWNPDMTAAALRRACSYGLSPAEQREVERLQLTVLSATGDVAGAWQQAQAHAYPLLLVTPDDTAVYQNAAASTRSQRRRTVTVDPTAGKLPAGSILEVTQLTDGRIRFDRAYQPRLTGDGLSFQPARVQTGWIDRQTLPPPSASRGAAAMQLSNLVTRSTN